MGFDIDDVKELFAEDMARFGRDLATHTQVLRANLMEVTGSLHTMGKAVDAIAVAFHAIAGTSSLLEIESTRDVALKLEGIAARIVERLATVTMSSHELDRLSEACEVGNAGLTTIIASELDKQRPEALAAASKVVWEIDRVIAPPPIQPGDDEQQELAEVFHGELVRSLAELEKLFDELEHGPDRAGALSRTASILHMMKGAAASVGATAAEIELRSAHDAVDDFLERGELPEPAQVQRIRGDVLALAPDKPRAIVNESIDDGWQDEASEYADPADVFRAEARGLLREVRAQKGASAHAKLFHRLKGSALVVDLPEIAAIAAMLEAAARDNRPTDMTLVDRLSEMITVEQASTTRTPVTPVDGELWQSFREEASELVEAIEADVKRLGDTRSPDAIITSLLGSLHTLKGAANTVGLTPIGRELHVVETILEQLHVDAAPARRALVVRVLIGVIERFRTNLRTAPSGFIDDGSSLVQAQAADLGKLTNDAGTSGSWIGASDSAWSRAEPNLLRGADADSESHDSESRESHGSRDRGSAERDSAPQRRFVRVAADRLDTLMDMVGELIISRSRVDAGLHSLVALQRDQEHRRKRITEIVDAFTEQAEYANLGGQARRQRDVTLGFGTLEFDVYEEVHVFARRLAEATSDVSDTSASMVGSIAQLAERTEELGRIVSTLQGQVNRARMVPLESVFTRLALAVRDAADRERKAVDLVVEGADVVIDKAIADNLSAPLLHLVRNAVAHGIEAAAARHAAGKAERGKVTVLARHEAGEIIIEVSDDGRGIDRAALYREGLAAGVLDATSTVDAPEVMDLVFAPGISTTREATEVAGRGMGGDVVKKSIQRLGGTASITNRPGHGVTFHLRLPVTLAITRAIVVRQAGRLFAVPMLFVERIVGADECTVEQGQRLRYGQELLPIVDITEGTGGRAFLVCAAGGKRLAIAADHVVAQEEIVVKRLGYLLDGHAIIAGASQRGDGELALVLDMHGLLERRAVREHHEPKRVRALPASKGADLRPAPTRQAASEICVLFVDDSLSVRRVAEATLKRLGVSVVTANDGREALERLRDHAITIVFTDLEMPRMHGYELIHEMRLLPAYKSIPVVVVSSRSGDKHIKKAIEAGANEYLTKPFSDERFATALAKLVPGYRMDN